MFCNKCGQALPDNATFCTNCGNNLTVKQQNANPNVQQQANVQQQVNVQQQPANVQQQFNAQQPNQGYGFNNQVMGQMPQQNIKTEPSPILKWLESAKDVFLSFFKKGYDEQPAKLLKENNHMWIFFAAVAILLSGLSNLIFVATNNLSIFVSKFSFFLLGFFTTAALFFGFATMLFVIAKIAKNDKVTYINALNSTSVAFLPVILATAVSCIFNTFSIVLAILVSIAATIMLLVLIMKAIEETIANTSCEKSFWIKAISIICVVAVYLLVTFIITKIIVSSSLSGIFTNALGSYTPSFNY